jgi:hypothetical protein
MFETTLGAFHMRKDVGQVSKSLGIDFNAGGDRSIRVRALNEQDSHGTLPFDLLVKVTSQSEISRAETSVAIKDQVGCGGGPRRG